MWDLGDVSVAAWNNYIVSIKHDIVKINAGAMLIHTREWNCEASINNLFYVLNIVIEKKFQYNFILCNFWICSICHGNVNEWYFLKNENLLDMVFKILQQCFCLIKFTCWTHLSGKKTKCNAKLNQFVARIEQISIETSQSNS